MHDFGQNIGIAFQIKDDLFDYGLGGNIGKPTGIDIKESKMTLPLIYALNKASSSEKRYIINIFKNHNTEPGKVKEVLSFVFQSGGIEHARERMNYFREKAFGILDTFNDSIYKESLHELVRFTIERDN
jgi:octaprenyl-diphosphate synthase